jgi:hypothetical protein
MLAIAELNYTVHKEILVIVKIPTEKHVKVKVSQFIARHYSTEVESEARIH